MDEMDAQYVDVYHQEVRWLSRGKVLRRCFDLRDEISVLRESKNGNIQVPTDNKWLSDLAFFVDVTELLSVLNVQLQGKDQMITQLFYHVRASNKSYCCSEDISQEVTVTFTVIIFRTFYVLLLLIIIIFRIICGVCIYIFSRVSFGIFAVYQADKSCLKVSQIVMH